MTEAAAISDLPRIGLVARDALRLLGLQTILGDGHICRVIPLSGPSALRPDQEPALEPELEMVVIDGSTGTGLFSLIAEFRRARPELATLVIGMKEDLEWVERVIGSGARGYLSHASSEDEVRMAIDVIRDGSIWAPRKVLARLLRSSQSDAYGVERCKVKFTRREHQVLELLVLGHPNRMIAGSLGVDEGTIKAHMGRLMRKAGVDNRTALSIRAIEQRWIAGVDSGNTKDVT